MTDWPEVRVAALQTTADTLESWLFAAGALSVTYSDELTDNDQSHAILEPAPGEVKLWDALELVGLFAQGQAIADVEAALQLAALGMGLELPDYRTSLLPDSIWEKSWMKDFVPMQFGARFWICPSHSDVIDTNAINLKLDPGLAFGTGTHATTALCLNWLAQDTGQTLMPFKGLSVIDYGCGSGVLAIAAALLGAEHVLAVDIDGQAIDATRRNAAANGVADRLYVGKPSLVDGESVDLLLANILFQPLLQLADSFSASVRPGGALILSGLLETQVEPLRLRYNETFDFQPGRSHEGWALMAAIRR